MTLFINLLKCIFLSTLLFITPVISCADNTEKIDMLRVFQNHKKTIIVGGSSIVVVLALLAIYMKSPRKKDTATIVKHVEDNIKLNQKPAEKLTEDIINPGKSSHSGKKSERSNINLNLKDTFEIINIDKKISEPLHDETSSKQISDIENQKKISNREESLPNENQQQHDITKHSIAEDIPIDTGNQVSIPKKLAASSDNLTVEGYTQKKLKPISIKMKKTRRNVYENPHLYSRLCNPTVCKYFFTINKDTGQQKIFYSDDHWKFLILVFRVHGEQTLIHYLCNQKQSNCGFLEVFCGHINRGLEFITSVELFISNINYNFPGPPNLQGGDHILRFRDDQSEMTLENIKKRINHKGATMGSINIACCLQAPDGTDVATFDIRGNKGWSAPGQLSYCGV